MGGIMLLHAPSGEAMLTLTTRLALRGPVYVLDTGNRFDAYQVARLARRHTAELDQVLNRLQVARAFTCYQVVTLFEQLPDTTGRSVAYVIFDLLATFYDESVSVNESYRLLRIVTGHLQRLREVAPAVVLSIRPPRRPERAGLARLLLDLADHAYFWEDAPAPAPPRLNL